LQLALPLIVILLYYTLVWGVVVIPVIVALRRLRQEDLEFKDSLGYILRPHFKKEREGKREGMRERAS
jgi:hypothetical protein